METVCEWLCRQGVVLLNCRQHVCRSRFQGTIDTVEAIRWNVEIKNVFKLQIKSFHEDIQIISKCAWLEKLHKIVHFEMKFSIFYQKASDKEKCCV